MDFKEAKEKLELKKETLNIIQTLIEENGLDMVRNLPTHIELPICLNLRKVIVNNKCFDGV